jgi:hypothetical protein
MDRGKGQGRPGMCARPPPAVKLSLRAPVRNHRLCHSTPTVPHVCIFRQGRTAVIAPTMPLLECQGRGRGVRQRGGATLGAVGTSCAPPGRVIGTPARIGTLTPLGVRTMLPRYVHRLASTRPLCARPRYAQRPPPRHHRALTYQDEEGPASKDSVPDDNVHGSEISAS